MSARAATVGRLMHYPLRWPHPPPIPKLCCPPPPTTNGPSSENAFPRRLGVRPRTRYRVQVVLPTDPIPASTPPKRSVHSNAPALSGSTAHLQQTRLRQPPSTAMKIALACFGARRNTMLSKLVILPTSLALARRLPRRHLNKSAASSIAGQISPRPPFQ